MITFGANFVQNINVKKLTPELSYKDKEVNFVKIDLSNSNDLKTLETTAQNWKNCTFADNIFYNANIQANNIKASKNFEFYALTTQVDDFKNLLAEKILGLMEIKKKTDENIHIDYVQIDPEIIYMENQPYKKCGSAMLTCLKKIFETKLITLTGSIENFYLQNGFKKAEGSNIRYYWQKSFK